MNRESPRANADRESEFFMQKELYRKSLHVIAAAMPFVLIYVHWKIAIFPLIVFTILNVLIDIYRTQIPWLATIYNFLFGKILRENERSGSITGSTCFFLSLTISYVLFCRILSVSTQILAVLYSGFMLGDAAAAWIGKNYGRLKIVNNKTLEGSLAFGLTSFLCTFWIMVENLHLVFIAASLQTCLEMLVVRLDDNFFVPLIGMSVMYFFLV